MSHKDMSDCILCKIVKGEAPSHKLWEDESFLAVLTIGPLNPGHTLLIPKTHVDYIFNLEEPLYSEVFQVARQLPQARFDTVRRSGDSPSLSWGYHPGD